MTMMTDTEQRVESSPELPASLARPAEGLDTQQLIELRVGLLEIGGALGRLSRGHQDARSALLVPLTDETRPHPFWFRLHERRFGVWARSSGAADRMWPSAMWMASVSPRSGVSAPNGRLCTGTTYPGVGSPSTAERWWRYFVSLDEAVAVVVVEDRHLGRGACE
jgi:hypothetical protein